MGGFAWVTLATNDSYSLGALVLAHSLRNVNTSHKLAVLITPAVSTSMRQELSNVFDLVKVVDVLDSKDETHLALLGRPELGITFTKLHCWNLTEFNKCVFLDADTLVLKNCDELFDREELSAAPDVGWPDCFNSGVFVYKPSEETFKELVKFSGEHGSFDGGDQGLLNQYFSDWATKDVNKHLPFVYNLTSVGVYSYVPALAQHENEIRIVHFIGTGKPWLQQIDPQTKTVTPDPGSSHLTIFLQKWWDLFCDKVHPSLNTTLECDSGISEQQIEACAIKTLIESSDELKPPASDQPFIPFTDKNDSRQINLPYRPFEVRGTSGEFLNVTFLEAREQELVPEMKRHEEILESKESVNVESNMKLPDSEQPNTINTEKQDGENNEECEKVNSEENDDYESSQGEVAEHCKKSETAVVFVENSHTSCGECCNEDLIEEIPNVEKSEFHFDTFFPDENCVLHYLKQNVMKYNPLHVENEELQSCGYDAKCLGLDKDLALPRFLAIAEDDQRQSLNGPIRQEIQRPINQEPTMTSTFMATKLIPIMNEPTKADETFTSTLSQESPSFPDNEEEMNLSNEEQKFLPDLETNAVNLTAKVLSFQKPTNTCSNGDLCKKYSKPKVRPLLPKTRCLYTPVNESRSKITQFTEFYLSNEYKELNIPSDKMGFVERQILKENIGLEKAEKSAWFGASSFQSVIDHRDSSEPKLIGFYKVLDCDLSFCQRQRGNIPFQAVSDFDNQGMHSSGSNSKFRPLRPLEGSCARSMNSVNRNLSVKRGAKASVESRKKKLETDTWATAPLDNPRVEDILEKLRSFSRNYQKYFTTFPHGDFQRGLNIYESSYIKEDKDSPRWQRIQGLEEKSEILFGTDTSPLRPEVTMMVPGGALPFFDPDERPCETNIDGIERGFRNHDRFCNARKEEGFKRQSKNHSVRNDLVTDDQPTKDKDVIFSPRPSVIETVEKCECFPLVKEGRVTESTINNSEVDGTNELNGSTEDTAGLHHFCLQPEANGMTEEGRGSSPGGESTKKSDRNEIDRVNDSRNRLSESKSEKQTHPNPMVRPIDEISMGQHVYDMPFKRVVRPKVDRTKLKTEEMLSKNSPDNLPEKGDCENDQKNLTMNLSSLPSSHSNTTIPKNETIGRNRQVDAATSFGSSFADKSGIAGAIANLKLQSKQGTGNESTSPSTASAQEDYIRRQNWEMGRMDYTGRDSFDKIWSKICETMDAKVPDKTDLKVNKIDSAVTSSATQSVPTCDGPTPEKLSDSQGADRKLLESEPVSQPKMITKDTVECAEISTTVDSNTAVFPPIVAENLENKQPEDAPSETRSTKESETTNQNSKNNDQKTQEALEAFGKVFVSGPVMIKSCVSEGLPSEVISEQAEKTDCTMLTEDDGKPTKHSEMITKDSKECPEMSAGGSNTAVLPPNGGEHLKKEQREDASRETGSTKESETTNQNSKNNDQKTQEALEAFGKVFVSGPVMIKSCVSEGLPSEVISEQAEKTDCTMLTEDDGKPTKHSEMITKDSKECPEMSAGGSNTAVFPPIVAENSEKKQPEDTPGETGSTKESETTDQNSQNNDQKTQEALEAFGKVFVSGPVMIKSSVSEEPPSEVFSKPVPETKCPTVSDGACQLEKTGAPLSNETINLVELVSEDIKPKKGVLNKLLELVGVSPGNKDKTKEESSKSIFYDVEGFSDEGEERKSRKDKSRSVFYDVESLLTEGSTSLEPSEALRRTEANNSLTKIKGISIESLELLSQNTESQSPKLGSGPVDSEGVPGTEIVSPTPPASPQIVPSSQIDEKHLYVDETIAETPPVTDKKFIMEKEVRLPEIFDMESIKSEVDSIIDEAKKRVEDQMNNGERLTELKQDQGDMLAGKSEKDMSFVPALEAFGKVFVSGPVIIKSEIQDVPEVWKDDSSTAVVDVTEFSSEKGEADVKTLEKDTNSKIDDKEVTKDCISKMVENVEKAEEVKENEKVSKNMDESRKERDSESAESLSFTIREREALEMMGKVFVSGPVILKSEIPNAPETDVLADRQTETGGATADKTPVVYDEKKKSKDGNGSSEEFTSQKASDTVKITNQHSKSLEPLEVLGKVFISGPVTLKSEVEEEKPKAKTEPDQSDAVHRRFKPPVAKESKGVGTDSGYLVGEISHVGSEPIYCNIDEFESTEEIRLTRPEDRGKDKPHSSKLTEQILKAIPPPRRKPFSEARIKSSPTPELSRLISSALPQTESILLDRPIEDDAVMTSMAATPADIGECTSSPPPVPPRRRNRSKIRQPPLPPPKKKSKH